MRSSSGVTTGVSCCRSPIISSCTPPKGLLCSRKRRSTESMASSRSLRTIDISSMMSRSSEEMMRRFSLLKSNLLLICALGTNGEKGSWKKEWMVTPSALIAATPVGATTTDRLRLCSTTAFRNVVLPVPALPVRKILRPVFSTKSHACLSSAFRSIKNCVSCYNRLSKTLLQRYAIFYEKSMK